MLKWIEIAGECDRERYRCLSESLANSGCENQVEFLETDRKGLEPALAHYLDEKYHVRVGPPFCTVLPNLIPQKHSLQLTLKSLDCLQPETDRWTGKSLVYEMIQRLLATKVKGLDLGGAAFVIGTDGNCRAVVAALARVGFGQINVTDSDGAKANRFVEEMKKIYFNVEFSCHDLKYLTQLPGVNSLVFNSYRIDQDSGELCELYYFNFMKPGGVVLDFRLDSYESQFIQEARQVKSQIFQGYELCSMVDSIWSSDVLNKPLNVDDYETRLAELAKNKAAALKQD